MFETFPNTKGLLKLSIPFQDQHCFVINRENVQVNMVTGPDSSGYYNFVEVVFMKEDYGHHRRKTHGVRSWFKLKTESNRILFSPNTYLYLIINL